MWRERKDPRNLQVLTDFKVSGYPDIHFEKVSKTTKTVIRPSAPIGTQH